jgi:hypothetical protein
MNVLISDRFLEDRFWPLWNYKIYQEKKKWHEHIVVWCLIHTDNIGQMIGISDNKTLYHRVISVIYDLANNF